jgi:Ca-activated chloride channel family protein
MPRSYGWIIVVSLFAGAAVSAQQTTRFRSGVDLVALNVVATDGEGRFVSGLTAADFTILEDGAPQDIGFFAATPLPIDLAILIDTSSSMADNISTVQAAAVGFVSAVRPGDRVTVVDIKDNVRVVHPLNEDAAGARAAIQATIPQGNTSLYNGLYMTLRELMNQREFGEDVRRQAIVVLSDGDDTTSLVAYDDVSELAKRSGVAIYTITLQSPYERNVFARRTAGNSEAEFAMKELAQMTGARAFFPMEITELAGVYGTIADELAHQYSLGYSPDGPRRESAFRRIDVRIERPGIRARTRTGYLAGTTALATQ